VTLAPRVARHPGIGSPYGRRMTQARQLLGRRGEELVAARLEAAGWRLVARNCRVREVRGELDLIALDGATLVFVEVKTMRAGTRAGPETPAAMVGHRKRAKLRSLAGAWLRQAGEALPAHRGLRFDVVALRLDGAGTPVEWNHIRAAF
jgi:putative endonuclease